MKLLSATLILAIATTGAFAREAPQRPSSSSVVAAPTAPVTLPNNVPETVEETAIRRALAELEGRRAEVAALKDTVKAKDAQIAALNALLEQQAQIIALWKTAATERATANAIDTKIEDSYKASVAAYEKELARVRADRDAQARQKKYWGAFGVGLGLLLGYFAWKR